MVKPPNSNLRPTSVSGFRLGFRVDGGIGLKGLGFKV